MCVFVERTFQYSVSSTCVYSVNDSSRIDEVAAYFCFPPPGARCKCVALSLCFPWDNRVENSDHSLRIWEGSCKATAETVEN